MSVWCVCAAGLMGKTCLNLLVRGLNAVKKTVAGRGVAANLLQKSILKRWSKSERINLVWSKAL